MTVTLWPFETLRIDLLFVVAEREDEGGVVGPSLGELTLKADFNPVFTL